MRRAPRGVSWELAVAVLILAAAVGVDAFWVRPRERALEAMTARRKVAQRAAELASMERAEWTSIQEYLNQRGRGEGTWRDRYVAADPLRILESTRERSGLKRLDLRLVSEKEASPFMRTTYFMSVNGSFARQVRFLKDLEMSQPLITVESFVMDTRTDDPNVDLKLNVSLLTLPETAP